MPCPAPPRLPRFVNAITGLIKYVHICLPLTSPLWVPGRWSQGLSHDLSPVPLTVSETPAPSFSWPWWYVLLGVGVAAACVFILAVFLIYRRKKETRYG